MVMSPSRSCQVSTLPHIYEIGRGTFLYDHHLVLAHACILFSEMDIFVLNIFCLMIVLPNCCGCRCITRCQSEVETVIGVQSRNVQYILPCKLRRVLRVSELDYSWQVPIIRLLHGAFTLPVSLHSKAPFPL